MSENELFKEGADLNKLLRTYFGTGFYTDEYACELLAWLHVAGGFNEAVVHNPSLSFALQICAGQLGIEGGTAPSENILTLFKAKCEELKSALAQDKLPAWLAPILERYKLRKPIKNVDY